MTKIILYIFLFFILNLVMSALRSINPILGYVLYAGLIFYFFRSLRFRTPRSQAGSYTYQEPVHPTPRSNGDVIDVEFTEHEEKSGN
jgi:hypothetical protein